MQTHHQVATNPQTKPTNMGCESACRLLATSTVAIYYYYQARKLILQKLKVDQQLKVVASYMSALMQYLLYHVDPLLMHKF